MLQARFTCLEVYARAPRHRCRGPRYLVQGRVSGTFINRSSWCSSKRHAQMIPSHPVPLHPSSLTVASPRSLLSAPTHLRYCFAAPPRIPVVVPEVARRCLRLSVDSPAGLFARGGDSVAAVPRWLHLCLEVRHSRVVCRERVHGCWCLRTRADPRDGRCSC
jgi:hypothetical protein